MPRLFRVIVPVPDMEAADAFYARMLDMEPAKVTPTRHYFDCDGVILALVDPSAHGRAFRANPDLVYLAVPDLEAALDRAVEAGARFLDDDDVGWGIQQRVWGERSAYFTDPFGNPLCLVDDTTLFTGSGEDE